MQPKLYFIHFIILISIKLFMKKLKLYFISFILIVNTINLSHAQVSPLVTTTWNQGCYYNASCPTVGSGGACGRAWTGCGATALGQVLKYHAHPLSGWPGNYCNAFAPSHCVDVGIESYNYSLMPNALTTYNTEVAKLLYHLGITLDMGWSGSSSNSAPGAFHFKKFWKYSLSTRGAIKAMYSNTEWENLIRAELDAGRVVVASGGSHIYVIDGYQTTPSLKFHINFGWGGLYDGYYNIHNVIAGSSNYTPGTLIIGIQPLTNQIETTTDTIVVSASASSLVPYEIAATAPWNISSNQSWITPNLTSGNIGYFNSSNGASASILANPNYTPRFATLTAVAGSQSSSFVVMQQGIQPYLWITPNNLTFSSAASGQSININTDSNWVATTTYSWITISPTSGTGNSSVTINVTANGPVARTGTVLISRGNLQQTISINQSSNSSFWCIPALNISGTNGLTNVTLNTINRSSANNEGYINTGLSTTLKLDSTYSLTCTFVGGNAPAIWIDWNIDGDFNDANEAIMPPSGTWYPTFNATKTLTFTVPSNAVEGTTRMRVYCKNFPNPTTGPCNTTDPGGDIEDYDIVVVDHRNIEVNPNSLSFIAIGGTQTITVTSDSTWIATCPASWISFSASTAIGNSTSDIIAAPNTGTTISRSTVATFTRGNKFKTVSITQAGEDTLLQCAIDTLWFPSLGGFSSINVNANVSFNINISDTWITTDLSTAYGISVFSIIIDENLNSLPRNGFVFVQSGSYSDTIFIVQLPAASFLSVTPDSLYYEINGDTHSVSILTNGSWNAYVSDPWIHLNNNNGSGNFNLDISVDTNFSSVRTGTVTITSGSFIYDVLIYQNGNFNTIEMSDHKIFDIYPNPAKEFIIINTPLSHSTMKYIITDLHGRTLLQGMLYNNTNTINLSNINPGIYIIQLIENQQNVKYMRFVKI